MNMFDDVEISTVEDYLKVAKQITYKQGYSFNWSESKNWREESIQLYLTVPVLDPRTLEHTNLVIHRVFPVYCQPVSCFLYDVKRLLIDWEVHELTEWLHYAGKNVDEPHPFASSVVSRYTHMEVLL